MPSESNWKKTNKSKIYNKAIRIKGNVNLSSLTKKQEKIFNTKYNDHIFDDNSKKLFSRSIFLRKMFERQNQTKLKKKYAKIYNLIKKIKKETKYISTETKEYFQYNLSLLNLNIQKEIDLINNSKGSIRRKQVKISFLNKMKNEIDLKRIEKIIEPFKNINKLKGKINDYFNIAGIIPGLNYGKSIVSCVLSTDNISSDNDWYKEKKQKIEDKLKNRNTNNVKISEESLKVDEINKEVLNLFLKSDDEKIKPVILK